MKLFTQTSQGMANIEKSRTHNSKIMKQKILDGKFTPNTNNRNTHWEAYYDGKKYRSSWEALFQSMYPSAEYEKLRITYFFENKELIYIVDFIDYASKTVIEVKPEKFCSGLKFNGKLNALNQWAKENGFTVLIANEYFFYKNQISSFDLFDKNTTRKVRKLYEETKNRINNDKRKSASL